MKYSKYLLLAAMASIFATSCEKDQDASTMKSFDMFYLGNTQFSSEDSKVALNFSSNRLLYEVDDIVTINGKEFTLSKTGSGSSTKWYAQGPDAVTASKFYCAYADGLSSTLSGSGSSVTFDFGGRLSSATNKILLGGVTDSNVLTLKPACAIIKLNADDVSYHNVRVGFESHKVLKSGTMNITADGVTLSGSGYMKGVTEGYGQTGNGADFLNMEYNSTEGYWYVAVPVSSSVTTTLFFYWELGNDHTPTGWKTSGRVTLSKGYVYSVGSSQQSPFNADGTSKNYFQVSSNSYVQFSPGNLQAQGSLSGNIWKFASTQLEVLGSTGASEIGVRGKTWDLFGFGTSNWNGSGATAYSASSKVDNDSEYLQSSLSGTNADWGVNNGAAIQYKGVASGTTWRTLTSAEWTYLLNRTDKVAFATVNEVNGIILLPDVASNQVDDWELPDGILVGANAFAKTSYTNNIVSRANWNTLEAAGAIFLPATGYREGTSLYNSSEGHYWSSTYDTGDGWDNYAYVFNFTGGSAIVTSSNMHTAKGRAVRLVHTYTPSY